MNKTIHSVDQLQPFLQWAFSAIQKGLESGPVVITFGREARTADQNKKLWPMLNDISKQVTWYGKQYDSEGWKDIITGSFKNCEFVPNIDGNGFVVTGLSTSRMRKDEFIDLIEFIYAFGASQKVVWSEPALKFYEDNRR